MPPRLPPEFTSLYRLFLRTTSASVLHHHVANRNLRRMMRPSFRTAAQVTHRLQRPTIADKERKTLERWLNVWERRVDTTLALLFSSATSHGIPHKITRNLTLLRSSWTMASMAKGTPRKWNPQLPPSATEYQVKDITPGSRMKKHEDKKRMKDKMDMESYGALGEVIKLAEGQQNLLLGRIVMWRKMR